jgi:hypothetical protein
LGESSHYSGLRDEGETFEELLHNLYEAVESCLIIGLKMVVYHFSGG